MPDDVEPVWSSAVVADDVDPFAQDEPERGVVVPSDEEWRHVPPAPEPADPLLAVPDDPTTTDPFDDPAFVEAYLTLAAAARAHVTVLPPTQQMIDAQAAREFDAAMAPVSRDRILQLNRLATDFYVHQFPGSWAQTYLARRMRTDLTGDPHVMPGYAPAGWTRLVDHLRRQGASDLELTESGLATLARTGRLIDRFRDRLVFPITRLAADGRLEPLGFVGRRHPDATDQTGGPKYLNSPETVLFHKGAQLFTVRADYLDAGAAPVLVEGPMDALAVTLAGRGAYGGVAPLGTALTEEQAAALAALGARAGASPVVATDADLAGQVAAERDYWLLTQHALSPTTTQMRPGSDPSSIMEAEGPGALHRILRRAGPLALALVQERLSDLRPIEAARAAAQVTAADSPANWDEAAAQITAAVGTPDDAVRRELARALHRRDRNARAAVADAIGRLSALSKRLPRSPRGDVAAPVPTHKHTPHPGPSPSVGPDAPAR
jgi:DNA primase catalytic core